ncbi:MAG: signal peptide peptidase SppA [Candidatus Diapherotrites archaeon]
MKAGAVLVVVAACILLLLGLGVLLSLLFAGFSPDTAFFSGGQAALIELKGDISNDSGLLSANLTAEETAALISKADSDPSISGILLEINSGGGSVVASKEIVRALRAAKKPKVAVIRDIGASGAYYAASACDFIIADEDSLTGSLGAISVRLNLADLREKIGIGADSFSKGENKGMGDPFSELSEEERGIMQSIVDQAWQGFKDNVLEFRGEKLDKKRLDEIFDGRIMSGKQALSYGLIDATGTKEDAIKKLGELTGIEEPSLRRLAPEKSLFSMLSQMGYSFGTGFKSSLSSGEIKLQS